MCEKYILAQNDVQSLSEVSWGGGWTQYKKELENTFRELTYLGYGIVFIAHSKTKATQYKDAQGEAVMAVYPDVATTGMNIINRLVDVIGYLSVEFNLETQQSCRYLYTRQTPTIFAGSRYKYLAEKIPFGYVELVNAIADAIEKQIQIDGAEATDSTVIKPKAQRTYQEIMNEARELWTKLTANENTYNVDLIGAIVKKHLGHEVKLSQITEPQKDILEMIVEEMREL